MAITTKHNVAGENNIYHMHHIVPKHTGGTNDSSNLVKLTVEEHALAHKKLWEKHGNEFDRIAWISLSSRITTEEARILASKEGMRRKPKTAAHMKAFLEGAFKANIGRKNLKHGAYISQLHKEGRYASFTSVSHFKGKHHSDKSKKLLSTATKIRARACCIKCHKPTNDVIHSGIWMCHLANYHKDC